MIFFQVQGICRKRKHFLGLSWYSYEPFYDDRLLPADAAHDRLRALTRGECLPLGVHSFESLHVREVTPGTFIDAGQQVEFILNDYYFTRF